MNIKELGLEELTVSEKKETRGGVAPLVVAGLIVAGLILSTATAHAPGTGGGGGIIP